jgi:predicted ester cyclase
MSQRTAQLRGEQGAAACQGDHRCSRGSANSSRRYPLHGQLGKCTAVSIAWNADTLRISTVFNSELKHTKAHLKHQLNRIVVDADFTDLYGFFPAEKSSMFIHFPCTGWYEAVRCCEHMQQYSAIMCNKIIDDMIMFITVTGSQAHMQLNGYKTVTCSLQDCDCTNGKQCMGSTAAHSCSGRCSFTASCSP